MRHLYVECIIIIWTIHPKAFVERGIHELFENLKTVSLQQIKKINKNETIVGTKIIGPELLLLSLLFWFFLLYYCRQFSMCNSIVWISLVAVATEIGYSIGLRFWIIDNKIFWYIAVHCSQIGIYDQTIHIWME